MNTRRTLLIIAFLVAVFSPFAAYAIPYEPLAPLPYATPNNNASLATYLPGMFRLIIMLTAFMAVVYIVIGGFQYITSDSIYGKSDGKGRIQDALIGLGLAMVSWIILYTINPNLVTFNLNTGYTTRSPQTSSPTGQQTNGQGVVLPPAGAKYTHEQAVAALGPGWQLSSSSGNLGCQATNCTSLQGINQTTIVGIQDMRQVCPTCGTLVITGGTEAGHSTSHTNGYKVDISTRQGDGELFTQNLSAVLQQQGLTPTNFNKNVTIGQHTYNIWLEDAGTSNEHWDITVVK